MTTLQLANTFNVLMICLVLGISMIVEQNQSKAFFSQWVRAYILTLALVFVPLLDGGADTFFATVLGIVLLILQTWYLVQTGNEICYRYKIPNGLLLAALGGIGLVSLLLAAVSGKLTAAILLPFLLSAFSCVRLGILFIRNEVLFNRYVSCWWLGIPVILLGTSPISYPFYPPSLRWLGYLIAAILHVLVGSGMIICMLEMTRHELTELKNQQVQARDEQIETLTQTDRLKDEFLAAISHELRNPLKKISQLASQLKQETVDDRKQTCFDEIRDNSETTIHLINSLIDYVNVRVGTIKIKPVRVTFSELIRRALASLRMTACEKNLQFDQQMDSGLEIEVDEVLVTRILIELYSVTIRVAMPHDRIVSRVCLIGENLGMEVQIQRTSQSSSILSFASDSFTENIGLQLKFCRELIDACGGTFGTRSQQPDGECFWLRLPVGDPGTLILA